MSKNEETIAIVDAVNEEIATINEGTTIVRVFSFNGCIVSYEEYTQKITYMIIEEYLKNILNNAAIKPSTVQ